MSETTKKPASGGYSSKAIPTLSKTTIFVTLALLASMALFYYFNVQWYEDMLSEAAGNAVYIWGILYSPIAAIIIFAVAFGFGKGESIRTQWMLMGVAVAVYSIGDFAWTYLDLVLGVDPYPSIADLFYTLEYVFFLAAIILAIRSYRAIVDIKMPVIIGAIVGVVGIGLSYYFILGPYILPAGPDELSAMGKFVGVLYSVGDIVFMLAPATALALTVSKLGRGRFAWPWWIVVIGSLMFAITDTWFTYADWAGEGGTALMDIGWILANVLFAIAALVARDVYRR
jgi:hypothetical protein